MCPICSLMWLHGLSTRVRRRVPVIFDMEVSMDRRVFLLPVVCMLSVAACGGAPDASNEQENGTMEATQDLSAAHQADLVTLRAVRIDDAFVDELSRLLSRGGLLLAFGGSVDDRRFVREAVAKVPDGSHLSLFRYLGR